MNREKKVFLGAVVAVALLLTGVGMYKVSAAGDAPAISILGGTFSNVFFGAGSQQSVPTERAYGSSEGDTTVFTAVSTTQDVGVGRNLFVAGQTNFAGTTTLSGDVGGVPKFLKTTMSSTSTACAVLNSSGSSRVVTGVSGVLTASNSVGTYGVNVGTSTTALATSTSPWVNSIVSVFSSSDSIINTSTMMSSTTGDGANFPRYGIWRNNEYVLWKFATTSVAGYCGISYWQ